MVTSASIALFALLTGLVGALRELQAPTIHEVSVVGGHDVIEQVSNMASIRKGDDHLCGGTLIASNVVLTAAHCLEKNNTPAVHIGRTLRTGPDKFSAFQTVRSIIHPGYNRAAR